MIRINRSAHEPFEKADIEVEGAGFFRLDDGTELTTVAADGDVGAVAAGVVGGDDGL
jgi:hypothetical protein